MASVGTYKDKQGRKLHRILFVHPDGGRKTIWLGDVSIKTRDAIRIRVEELVSAMLYGRVPDDDTTRWITKQKPSLLKKLANVGLIEAHTNAGSKPLTVSQFCDQFIAGRPEMMPGTVTNYRQAKDKLVEFLGESKKLARVTALDADRFRSWMKGTQMLAENTCRTHVKNAKLIFGAAQRGKLITTNPFAGHKTAVSANPERMEFVDRASLPAKSGRSYRRYFSVPAVGVVGDSLQVIIVRPTITIVRNFILGEAMITTPEEAVKSHFNVFS